ncbi:MAG: hypothetical protein ABJF11_10725 [Reichenbachiella sp.]|uniref:hypothetical protein n=1 Tax=Reichenbachiella sp. TaxID=2184521 RepID=UPI0032644165
MGRKVEKESNRMIRNTIMKKGISIFVMLICLFFTGYISIKIDLIETQVSLLKNDICLIETNDSSIATKKNLLFIEVSQDVKAIAKASKLLNYVFVIAIILIIVFPLLKKRS